MSANKTPDNQPLTKSETPMLKSPTAGRGRGTTGGGGKTLSESGVLMGRRLNGHLQVQKNWMEKPGCGNPDHDKDCLHDVVLKEISPIIVNLPNDMMYATVICEHMELEAPWDVEKMLQLLGMCSRAHDMLHDKEGESRIWRHNRKVTDEAREFMADAVDAGTKNKEVMRQVKELFDIEISQAYISKRRYIYNGTKGAKK